MLHTDIGGVPLAVPPMPLSFPFFSFLKFEILGYCEVCVSGLFYIPLIDLLSDYHIVFHSCIEEDLVYIHAFLVFFQSMMISE